VSGDHDALHAVLLDMDGLLVDSEPTWFAVETDVMAALGGPWGHEHQAALLGGSLESSSQYLLDLSGRADVSVREVAQQLLDGMVTRLRRGPVHWMPGAQRLLAGVEAAGLPRALVSSSSRVIVDAVLDALGAEHFHVTVSGDDVSSMKPHPDPYLRAAALLGVDAGSCLVFEDSIPGATSARSAGCVTVVVPGAVPVPADLADLQVGSLEAIDPATLGELMAGLLAVRASTRS